MKMAVVVGLLLLLSMLTPKMMMEKDETMVFVCCLRLDTLMVMASLQIMWYSHSVDVCGCISTEISELVPAFITLAPAVSSQTKLLPSLHWQPLC
jgi:hypothetical protein